MGTASISTDVNLTRFLRLAGVSRPDYPQKFSLARSATYREGRVQFLEELDAALSLLTLDPFTVLTRAIR